MASSTTYPSKYPPEDTAQNIQTISGYKADNRLELVFKRNLNTGDTTQDFLLKRNTQLNLVWAFGFVDR